MMVLHFPLSQDRNLEHGGSHLLYEAKTLLQRQTAVKLYGVFVSHWRSLAYSPERQFHWVPARDSGKIVEPFRRAVI